MRRKYLDGCAVGLRISSTSRSRSFVKNIDVTVRIVLFNAAAGTR